MKIIAHRGNLTGPNPLRENSIDYIEEAISEGFDVEIDLWVEDNQCHLGHDGPQLTSKGIGWVLVGQIPFTKSIIVLPEAINYYDKYNGKYDRILNTMGICTDKPLFYKNEL